MVPDTPHRRCPKCRTDRTYDLFVLLTESERVFGRIRRWCLTCIEASTFANHRAFKSARARMARARATSAHDAAVRHKAEAAIKHRIESNDMALRLYDQAAADPTFAAALRLATSALDFPRADLEAVI